MSSTARSRALAVVSGALSLVASLVFALVVSRRLPPEDLALLNVFNSAYAIGTSITAYVTGWYPRVLAREPAAYGRLFAAGLVLGLGGWAAGVSYLFLFAARGLEVDWPILALLGAMLALHVVPAGAYLSVYRQTTAAALGVVSQVVKIGGAQLVRTHPTAETALLISLFMSLPNAVAVRKKPDFSQWRKALREVVQGAPFQTLATLATSGGALLQYAVILGGGVAALYYGYLLFQFSKMVYPALAVVPLMYGSMLLAEKIEKRALLDGALLIYIYLAASALMLNAPQYLIALVRPQELTSQVLINAMTLNSVALLLSGVYIHISNVMMAEEKKPILSIRDRPAKALLFDLATTPLWFALAFYLVALYGAVGLVAVWIVSSLTSIAVRLRYVYTKSVMPKLYAPGAAALAATYLLPRPPLELKAAAAEALINVAVLTAYYGGVSAAVFTALSTPAREALRRVAAIFRRA